MGWLEGGEGEGRTVVAFGVVVDVEGLFGDEVGDVFVFGLLFGIALGGGHGGGCSGIVCWWRGGGGVVEGVGRSLAGGASVGVRLETCRRGLAPRAAGVR